MSGLWARLVCWRKGHVRRHHRSEGYDAIGRWCEYRVTMCARCLRSFGVISTPVQFRAPTASADADRKADDNG